MSDDKVAEGLTFLGDLLSSQAELKILALADKGWEAFYTEIFGEGFVEALDSAETDDMHHSDALNWHWEARLALLRGERPPGDISGPWFVYFPTWARGNMKTTLARAMLIVDAMLTFAYKKRGYALIPGGTKNKVRTHASSIEAMLHSAKVQEYCPQLSRVQKNVMGRSRGWTASYIETEAGYVFHFVGLEEGMAGANLEGVRPTFIVPDDIDNRNDSPVEAETKLRVFTSEVLPSRQGDTLVFWAQNVISRMSVRYRFEKQHFVGLTDRKATSAVPAVRGFEYERRTMPNGLIKIIVTAGKCTWRKWDLQRVQDEINTYGLDAFLKEMQHEVEMSAEGNLFKTWNDDIHVISESEFESVYGTRNMPARWPKEWANDWARTKTARHANVAFWRTTSSQNSALPGMSFIFHPMSFNANAQVEDVAERLLTALEPQVQVSSNKWMTWNDLRIEELIRQDALTHTSTQLGRIEYERDALQRLLPTYVEPLMERQHVLGGVNSHEREDIREIYNRVYGMRCTGVNPGKFGGIEQLNRDMMVDLSHPHPFREQQMGYTRFFLVSPDDLTQEPRTVITKTGPMQVYPPHRFTDSTAPELLHDHELFRYQMVNFRAVPAAVTLSGEIIDRPEKSNDDFANALQFCAVLGPLQHIPLTPKEEFEELIPDRVRDLTKEPMTKHNQHQIAAAAHFARLQLTEKYGEEFLDELAEEPDLYEW